MAICVKRFNLSSNYFSYFFNLFFDIFTSVFRPIRIKQLASSVHFRLIPLSNIDLSIREYKLPFTLHESFKEITFVCSSIILPNDLPLSLLESEFKMTIVHKVFLLFNSNSMLSVFCPLTVISVSIHMHEGTCCIQVNSKQTKNSLGKLSLHFSLNN